MGLGDRPVLHVDLEHGPVLAANHHFFLDYLRADHAFLLDVDCGYEFVCGRVDVNLVVGVVAQQKVLGGLGYMTARLRIELFVQNQLLKLQD